MSYWRLTLDPVGSFCTEPGFTQAQQGKDFRITPKSQNNTWIDPITGTLMLKPSFVDRDFFTGFHVLSDVRTAANAWSPVKRGQDQANMMSMVKPAGSSAGFFSILTGAVIQTINSAMTDNLVWAMETNYLLPQDAAFAIHYHLHADELIAKDNMMYVQWANIGLHFGFNGLCTVFQFADTATPVATYQFEFAQPNEICNRHNRIIFLPIPGAGLLFMHNNIATRNRVSLSSAEATAPRGHLIPFASKTAANKSLYLFPASQIRIGLNEGYLFTLGVQDVTFPSSGTFTDDVLDPRYLHTQYPDFVTALVRNTSEYAAGGMGVTATLRNPNDSADWVPGSDLKGRVKMALASANNRYSPFIYGWGVQWSARFASRNTTPLVLSMKALGTSYDYLNALEFTQDEQWRFEGAASMIIQTAAGKAIAERGDATFLLEKSEDNATWEVVDGGFAKDWELTPVVSNKTAWHYEAKCMLRGYWWRFQESELISQTAFDGVAFGDAVNKILLAAGFPQMDTSTIPTTFKEQTLPSSSDPNRWKLAPREGDKAIDILDHLFLLSRQQYTEWYLRFDWEVYLADPNHASGWKIEKKPRDFSTYWQLKPQPGSNIAGSRIWQYGDSPDLRAIPPEANVVTAQGLASADPNSNRITSDVIVNYASLTDTSSKDYLGRNIGVVGEFITVQDPKQINIAARRLYDAMAHRRITAERVQVHQLQMSLAPNVYVQFKDVAGNVILDGFHAPGTSDPAGAWIKRRTISVVSDKSSSMDALEHMDLLIDSTWEGLIN